MYWVKQTLSSVHNPHIIENKTLHIIQGNIPHAKDEVTTGCLLLTRIFVKMFISYQHKLNRYIDRNVDIVLLYLGLVVYSLTS